MEISIIEDKLAEISAHAADAMDRLQEIKTLTEKMEKDVQRTQRELEALYVSLEP